MTTYSLISEAVWKQQKKLTDFLEQVVWRLAMLGRSASFFAELLLAVKVSSHFLSTTLDRWYSYYNSITDVNEIGHKMLMQ